MSDLYFQLHELFNSGKRYYFPFNNDLGQIPLNGIYILFEKGEKYMHLDRIVRVGTHTGQNQLRSRLLQHFVMENKNRSIFRKNIGRAILNKVKHPYLKIWELDTTSKTEKIQNRHLVDIVFERELEKQISKYIQENLSFTVFEENTKVNRLFWESRIISTLAGFNEIKVSDDWLGRFSSKDKICKYGLWQVNELLKKPLDLIEFSTLTRQILNSTCE